MDALIKKEKYTWRKLIEKKIVTIQGATVERKTYKVAHKTYIIHHRILSYG